MALPTEHAASEQHAERHSKLLHFHFHLPLPLPHGHAHAHGHLGARHALALSVALRVIHPHGDSDGLYQQ
jgi:hypothetical protein